jgi:hypothetical protein
MLPHLKKWRCDCIGCQALRAGACLDCAIKLHARIQAMNKPGQLAFQPYSGACHEALERVFDERGKIASTTLRTSLRRRRS